ncbi:mitochondrial fission factor-like isoform X3 [Clarias gariepinus]|uniref:mitochondrial fission factor-like isoform X3 n=1 Tax=Clarias gariepinus TaxID=13013 RepID=UPI00234E17B9|nr:mitochondrial fission factor-like isoform X3 [Clarias gariepinus]
MTAPMYLVDGSPLRDPIFTAVISERMRVPERLQVTQSAVEDLKARAEDLPAAFSMHVPDRLALTDAPDLSPRPHFSQHVPRGHAFSKRNLRQEPWDGDATSRGLIQSPLRRSYSDQTFGRTLSGTPGRSKHGPSASTTQEFWRNPEEESGTTVELMVLRRQMMKMNRRITSLEKQNADRRQSEVLLLSLLLSACVINGWLWIRK